MGSALQFNLNRKNELRMSRERSILERLANRQSDVNRTTRQDESLLLSSVLEHVGKMLNTRRGNAPVAPDYGIPDIVDMIHSFPESIRIMEQAIRDTIEKYEPRLSNIRVRHTEFDEEIFSLHFEVTAALVLSSSKKPVRFETKVDNSGEVSVR
jgi:type VI secretion system protein